MTHTVVVGGTAVTVGQQTTVATLRRVMGVREEVSAFYRTDDVVHLLHDTEPVVERIPEGAVIEFHPGPIGPDTELGTGGTRRSDTGGGTE